MDEKDKRDFVTSALNDVIQKKEPAGVLTSE